MKVPIMGTASTMLEPMCWALLGGGMIEFGLPRLARRRSG